MRIAVALAATLGVALGLGSGVARAAVAPPALVHGVAASTSSNWAGYAVAGTAGAATAFTAVSGSWTQPAVTCTPGVASYSAFWLGLGGFADGSRVLEQIGTEADCTTSGRARYSAWYELVPSPAVPLSLAVSPGDAISASVSVAGTSVTLTLTDTTTGASATRTLAVASPDTSSAEWIAEAPSTCGGSGSGCRPLPLASFGAVTFSSAATTAAGHTGTVSDPAWSATAVTLQGSAASFFRSRFAAALPVADAVPGALSADGSSFAVAWQQEPVSSSTPPGWGRGWGWGRWGRGR